MEILNAPCLGIQGDLPDSAYQCGEIPRAFDVHVESQASPFDKLRVRIL
jgi:hypothetical protein